MLALASRTLHFYVTLLAGALAEEIVPAVFGRDVLHGPALASKDHVVPTFTPLNEFWAMLIKSFSFFRQFVIIVLSVKLSK